MKKIRPELFMFLAAFTFMVVAVFAERPAVYISLGAMFLILAIGVLKKRKEATNEKEA